MRTDVQFQELLVEESCWAPLLTGFRKLGPLLLTDLFIMLTFQSRTALPPAAQDVYLGNAEQALLPILAAFDPNSRQMQANSESVYSTAQSLNGNLGYQHFESSPGPVTGYVFPEGFYLCRFLLQ